MLCFQIIVSEACILYVKTTFAVLQAWTSKRSSHGKCRIPVMFRITESCLRVKWNVWAVCHLLCCFSPLNTLLFSFMAPSKELSLGPVSRLWHLPISRTDWKQWECGEGGRKVKMRVVSRNSNCSLLFLGHSGTAPAAYCPLLGTLYNPYL